jgi:hypothetical protein
MDKVDRPAQAKMIQLNKFYYWNGNKNIIEQLTTLIFLTILNLICIYSPISCLLELITA